MHRLSSLGSFLNSVGLAGVGTVVGTGPDAAAVRRGLPGRWKGRLVDEYKAAGLPPGGLDVVYIDDPDGGRGFDAALAAVRRWWPAVRDGGVLAGAGYYDGVAHG